MAWMCLGIQPVNKIGSVQVVATRITRHAQAWMCYSVTDTETY